MSKVEVLPNSWDEGLTPSTVTKVNKLCDSINTETGSYFKSVVRSLAEIRKTLKEDKNWLVFCSSGQLPFSSRQIRDLVQASEWLSMTGVSDNVLGRLSTRTIARIGGIQNDETLSEIESRLTDGEIMSYQAVMDCIGLIKADSKNQPKEKSAEEIKFAEASKKQVVEWYQEKSAELDKVSEKVDGLTEMVETLTKENERLNQMVNLFERLANQSSNAQSETNSAYRKVLSSPSAVEMLDIVKGANGSAVGAEA